MKIEQGISEDEVFLHMGWILCFEYPHGFLIRCLQDGDVRLMDEGVARGKL